MDKKQIMNILRDCLGPLVVFVLGLLLLLSPGTASTLVGKLLGWVLVIAGAVYMLGGLPKIPVSSYVIGGICVIAGIWLLARPLALTAGVGRVVGALIMLKGVQDLINARKAGLPATGPALTAAGGLLLLLVPVTVSHLVLRLCGVALILCGATGIYSRLIQKSLPKSGDDVIDL